MVNYKSTRSRTSLSEINSMTSTYSKLGTGLPSYLYMLLLKSFTIVNACHLVTTAVTQYTSPVDNAESVTQLDLYGMGD